MGHYLGLAHLGREALGAKGIPVHATESMIRFLSENGPWDLLIRLGNIHPTPIAPGTPIRLREGLSVTPIVSPHRQEYSDTVGYILEGSRRILYVPDTDGWDDWEMDIEDLCRGMDVSILDGTFYSGAELPGRDMTKIPHPLVTETVSRLRAIAKKRPGTILFTHLNHTNPLLDPDGKERAEIQALGFGVVEEGMRFPLRRSEIASATDGF
jgi:pyrroloquinoline quinone biosynthesis protein B